MKDDAKWVCSLGFKDAVGALGQWQIEPLVG